MTLETQMTQRGIPVSRRQVARALAWTAPVVLSVTAAPASAASTQPTEQVDAFYDVQVVSVTHQADNPDAMEQSANGEVPVYFLTSKGKPRTLAFQTVLRNNGTLPVPGGTILTLSVAATARREWGRRSRDHYRYADYPVLTSVTDGYLFSVAGDPYEVTLGESVPEVIRRQDYRLETPIQPGQTVEVKWRADVKYAIAGYKVSTSGGSQFRVPPEFRPLRNIKDDVLVETGLFRTKHSLR